MLGAASKTPSGTGGTKRKLPKAIAGTRQDDRDNVPPASGQVRHPSESRMNKIARRAHEIYGARGGEHGKAMEDWLQAEREVDAEIETSRTDDGE
jgi:hypothetical protein